MEEPKQPGGGNVIRMSPVEARPCEHLPGATVFAKVSCPWFEEPIGWIVVASEIPSGKRRRRKSRETWSFLPTCSLEPAIHSHKNTRTLLTAVRKQYRGIYDRPERKRRPFFAHGDGCEIGSAVLDACGLGDAWWDNRLGDDYSVLEDLVHDCPSAEAWDKVWEDGGPGLRGVWYRVHAENPSRFIREARLLTEKLIAEKKAKPPPPPPVPKRSRATKLRERKLAANLLLPLED